MTLKDYIFGWLFKKTYELTLLDGLICIGELCVIVLAICLLTAIIDVVKDNIRLRKILKFSNYDRIKAMSIEEMAKALANEIPHVDCFNYELYGGFTDEEEAKRKEMGMKPCEYGYYLWLKGEKKR